MRRWRRSAEGAEAPTEIRDIDVAGTAQRHEGGLVCRGSRVTVGWVRAHRLRYDLTSPTGATVWHGRSSGNDARWSDIAYSDVVRVVAATQDSTIGLAQDQRQARSGTGKEA